MSKKNKHGSQFPKPNSPSTPAVTPAPVATVPNPRQPKNEAMLFDPRTIGTPVYERLSELRTRTNDQAKLRKQKSMAQEIYTYLSTWGLMRLKAEETIFSDKRDGREDPVRIFFECLQELSGKPDLSLENLKSLSADDYLGLTGLALEIAREFSFWVSAVYHDVAGDDR